MMDLRRVCRFRAIEAVQKIGTGILEKGIFFTSPVQANATE